MAGTRRTLRYAVFARKRHFDPDGLFQNMFYTKYVPATGANDAH